MRRLTGLLLALSMFQLTALDLRTECERHAAAASAAQEHAGHDMASMHHESNSNRDAGETSVPTPKCCMMAGTCASSAFSTIVLASDTTVSDGDAIASVPFDLPSSLALAP